MIRERVKTHDGKTPKGAEIDGKGDCKVQSIESIEKQIWSKYAPFVFG